MKKYAILVVALAAPAAFAATPIDEVVDADGARTLDVSNIAGRVNIVGTDDDEVTVSGSLSDSAERIDVRREGSRIIVHVVYPRDSGRRRGSDNGTELEIAAPEELDLVVSTVSARITADNVHGEQQIESVSGSIETTLYENEIRARTTSGRIEIRGMDEPTRADVASVSGRVRLDAVSGEINAQTVSGGIDVRSAALERAELKAVSGGITVNATLTESARLRTLTTSGSISLSLDGSPAGQYEVSSFSGTIDNCFGPTPSRQRFGPPSSTLRFEEDGAAAQITANSMSGSIDICK